jgi:hypothetical protein
MTLSRRKALQELEDKALAMHCPFILELASEFEKNRLLGRQSKDNIYRKHWLPTLKFLNLF